MKLQTTINAKAKTAELLIYGPIGQSFWDENGVTAKDFSDALNAIPPGTQITIGINSQGGAIGEGLAIFNAIQRRADEITARIDGYALSAGSFIPLAAGKVISPDSAIWMIHRGWSYAMGNADDMRKQAEVLDKHDDTLIDIYTAKTGKDRAVIVEDLSDETWLTGAEAVAYGLADESGGDTDAEAMAAVDLSQAPAGTFKRNPIQSIAALFADESSGQVRKEMQRIPVADPSAPLLQTAGTVLAAAQTTNKKEESDMETKETNAQATTEKPAVESNAPTAQTGTDNGSAVIIDVLNDIKDGISALATPRETVTAAEPIAPAKVENLGNAADKLKVMENGAKRRRFLADAWGDIRKAKQDSLVKSQGLTLPQAVNTISSDLTVDMLSQTVITDLQARLAPLNALFTQVELQPIAPKSVIQVPNVTAGPTVQTNPTDWESGNATVAAVAVTPAEISASWHMTNAQLQAGNRIEWLSRISAAKFANAIMDVITTLLTTTAFSTNSGVTSAAASFGVSDLQTLWADAKNFTMRNLVVDGAYWARIMPATTQNFALSQGNPAYGFDGCWYHNDFASASNNITGFVASPEAIAVASGLPLEPPGVGQAFSQLGTVTIPELQGMSIQVASWFKPGTRVQWMAYDVIFGAAVGDETALTPLKSA